MKPQQSHHIMGASDSIFFINIMTYQLVLKKYIKEKTQKYCFLINNI